MVCDDRPRDRAIGISARAAIDANQVSVPIDALVVPVRFDCNHASRDRRKVALGVPSVQVLHKSSMVGELDGIAHCLIESAAYWSKFHFTPSDVLSAMLPVVA